MTAKLKSKELYEKFLPLVDCGDNRYTTTDQEKNAKQCALIAVDEILSANQIWYADSIPSKYWQEVKNELNQL
jgi:hypothetical protein